MKCGRGNRPPHARAGTTEGCAAGSRRGLARRKSREPSLGSAGPRAPFTFGWVPSAWLDARVSPQGAARANAGVKHVASCRGRGCDAPQPWPVHRRSAEVVRPFSGTGKRALGSERVESPNEARGGWTVSSQGWNTPGAQAHGPQGAKRERRVGAGRSSSRERPRDRRTSRGPFVLRRGRKPRSD
jgi:hypothetical protein